MALTEIANLVLELDEFKHACTIEMHDAAEEIVQIETFDERRTAVHNLDRAAMLTRMHAKERITCARPLFAVYEI